MLRHRCKFAPLLLVACWTMVFPSPQSVAEDSPANPSFSNTADVDLLAHDFGTFRQGAPTVTFNIPVTNLPASMGTTSPMSLTNVAALGDSTSIVLQSGTISGVAAGSSVTVPLLLNTTFKSGNLQVSYLLSFSSDSRPDSAAQQLAISAYAKILPSGDYNNDGNVDAADYVLWRSTQGHSVMPGTGADGDFNGLVNSADYTVWRSNFGQKLQQATGSAAGSESMLSTSSVPEPSSLMVCLMGLALFNLYPTGRERLRRTSLQSDPRGPQFRPS